MVFEMIPELLLAGAPNVMLRGAVGILVGLIFYQLLLSDSHEHKRFWKKHDWVGLRAEWFPKFRASLRTISGIREMLEDGYEKVSSIKHSRFSGSKHALGDVFN